jgi:hypothetical protein
MGCFWFVLVHCSALPSQNHITGPRAHRPASVPSGICKGVLQKKSPPPPPVPPPVLHSRQRALLPFECLRKTRAVQAFGRGARRPGPGGEKPLLCHGPPELGVAFGHCTCRSVCGSARGRSCLVTASPVTASPQSTVAILLLGVASPQASAVAVP